MGPSDSSNPWCTFAESERALTDLSSPKNKSSVDRVLWRISCSTKAFSRNLCAAKLFTPRRPNFSLANCSTKDLYFAPSSTGLLLLRGAVMMRPARITAFVFFCACTASPALAHDEPDEPLTLRKPPQSGVQNKFTIHMRMELSSSKKKIVSIDPNVNFLVSNWIAGQRNLEVFLTAAGRHQRATERG